MLKKALLFLSALSIGATAGAQTGGFRCVTDEVHRSLLEKFPEIAINEAELERQVKEGLKHFDLGKSSADPSQLGNPDFVYHIPIVVHIVHDYSYGSSNLTKEYISDDVIFRAVDEWNLALNKQNPDTADVIPAFRPYIGNPHIKVHLATKDPNGNPTNGITRHFSYLTKNTGTLAKIGGWPNASYMNIWVIRSMEAGSQAAAFALKPAAAQQLPWYDGVMTTAQYFSEETFSGSDKTIPHELAHTFNIDHVWGGTNEPNVACGDDNVDDTPPTKGHTSPGNNDINCDYLTAPVSSPIWDSTCSFGYLKVYASINSPGIDSLVDYPDTNNSQNIMDYTYCSRMFSKGQAYRMHEALNTNVAGRNNLWSQGNLAATGALDARPDLDAKPDFFVSSGYGPSNITLGSRYHFLCANDDDKFSFTDASWGDTIVSRTWQFSNNPNISMQTDTFVRLSFGTPGWVTTTLTATGNNTDPVTVSKQLIYVADGANKIDPVSNGFYYMEWNNGPDMDKWPIFNYYENDFKWKVTNSTGYYDNTSIMYTGYDNRSIPAAFIGTPEGDMDDFFSPAFNLSGMQSGDCNLNYMFAGTAMSAFATDMKDVLYVHYSTDCGKTWVAIDSMKQGELFNNGNYTGAYQPQWMGEWELMSINIPPAARVDGVFFRFRYVPHVNSIGAVTSNNFYLDRINISNFPLGANTLISEERKIVVAPNPTNGSSNIIISGEVGATADVVVTDITGKLVFKTSEKLTSSNYNTIVIPAETMTAKGIYMVQVKTGGQSHTEKLVVY